MPQGQTNPLYTHEFRTEFARLWQDKTLTTTAIGETLGICKNAVVSLRRRMDLEKRPSPIRRASSPATLPPQPRQASPQPRAAAQPPVAITLPENPPAPPPALPAPACASPPEPERAEPQMVAPEPAQPAARPGRQSEPCVFPYGNPGKPGFRFCGKPVMRRGAPYCAGCASNAYGKPARSDNAAAGRA